MVISGLAIIAIMAKILKIARRTTGEQGNNFLQFIAMSSNILQYLAIFYKICNTLDPTKLSWTHPV